jgi:hypothetical protein
VLSAACTSTPKPRISDAERMQMQIAQIEQRRTERERQQREKEYALADRVGVDRAAVDWWHKSGKVAILPLPADVTIEQARDRVLATAYSRPRPSVARRS